MKGETVDDWYPLSGKLGEEKEGTINLVLSFTVCILHAHIHPYNGPLPGTTQVSQYQKGKTNLDFTEARDSE